jgi:anti-sigma-K factor RskA
MKYDDPELIDALSAEYVLGTLRGPARRRFERWRTRSWHIERRVQSWEERFVHLALALTPVSPSAQTWREIEKRTMARTAPAQRPVRRTGTWQALAAAVLVAGIIAAGVMVYRSDLAGADLPTFATITAADGQPIWRIDVSDDFEEIRAVTVNRATVRPGTALELWALPDGGAPVSLGLLPASGRVKRTLTDAQQKALRGSPKVAVSLEPAGGSPTGAPTGPVLFVADRASTV